MVCIENVILVTLEYSAIDTGNNSLTWISMNDSRKHFVKTCFLTRINCLAFYYTINLPHILASQATKTWRKREVQSRPGSREGHLSKFARVHL